MPFELSIFAAQLALGLIPTEDIPLHAQKAMEAGFDGPKTVRVALLEGASSSEINAALHSMLEELHCTLPTAQEAALQLARAQAKRIFDQNEDPLKSIPYFQHLYQRGDYLLELLDIAYADDLEMFFDEATARQRALEFMQELLDPVLHQQKQAERNAEALRQLEAAKKEWPYKLNSTSGKNLLKTRWKDKVSYSRPVLYALPAIWACLGWGTGSWKFAFFGFLIQLPMMLALTCWTEWYALKRERRDILRRRGVPESEI